MIENDLDTTLYPAFKGGYLNNVSVSSKARGGLQFANHLSSGLPFLCKDTALLLLVLVLRLMQVVRLWMMVGEAARMVTMMLTDG